MCKINDIKCPFRLVDFEKEFAVTLDIHTQGQGQTHTRHFAGLGYMGLENLKTCISVDITEIRKFSPFWQDRLDVIFHPSYWRDQRCPVHFIEVHII